MTSLTPRQRRHRKTKQAILDAARKLIVEKGVDNLSLREIARKADYSPAGLYEYFNSKEEILLALGLQINQQLIAEIKKVPEELSPDQRLVELCLAYVAFALHHPEYFTLLNNLPSRRRSLNEQASADSSYLLFMQAVQALVDSHNIQLDKAYGVEGVTYGLWAQVHGMATLLSSHLLGFEADFDTANRLTIETFIKGLYASHE